MILRLVVTIGAFLFIEVAGSRFGKGVYDGLVSSRIHYLFNKDAVCYPEFILLTDMW